MSSAFAITFPHHLYKPGACLPVPMYSLFNYQCFFGVCVKLNKCMIAEFMKKSVKAFLVLQSKFFSEFMLQLATSSVKLSLIDPSTDIWEEQTYMLTLIRRGFWMLLECGGGAESARTF